MYMHVKNDLPGVVHAYMDAAGCTDESSWLIWVQVTQISCGAHNLLEPKCKLVLTRQPPNYHIRDRKTILSL
jgi:hypothetical protein